MQHPHFTPTRSWEHLFDPKPNVQGIKPVEHGEGPDAFIPSKRPAHEEILRILQGNEPDTVTIIAVAPLTNLALAASQDPETFLRAKEVVVMGGAIGEPGNVAYSFPRRNNEQEQQQKKLTK